MTEFSDSAKYGLESVGAQSPQADAVGTRASVTQTKHGSSKLLFT